MVQVIQEYGHQQHMGPPPAQETIRGKLVWQLGLVTQTHRVHQHVFNETQSLFDRNKLTNLLHFNERNFVLALQNWQKWSDSNIFGQLVHVFER